MIDIHNNEIFELFTYPSGEVGIKWLKKPTWLAYVYLLARLNTAQDLIKLLTITDACKRLGYRLEVTIPIFPGSRQDRVANFGDPLSVKIYADIINSQGYQKVNIVDAHSEVTPALINNVNILPVRHIIQEIIRNEKYSVIIAPDVGSAKKIQSYYFPEKSDRQGLTFIQGLKKRDTVTGKLSGFALCEKIPSGSNVLIVDDLAENAGSHIGLADIIWQEAPYINCLSLYVTHGLFPNGTAHLFKQSTEKETWFPFYKVYCTNTVREETEGVKTYKCV